MKEQNTETIDISTKNIIWSDLPLKNLTNILQKIILPRGENRLKQNPAYLWTSLSEEPRGFHETLGLVGSPTRKVTQVQSRPKPLHPALCMLCRPISTQTRWGGRRNPSEGTLWADVFQPFLRHFLAWLHIWDITHRLHGTAIYAYIDPLNHFSV